MPGESLVMGTVYTAGLLSFFSPCIFPVLPVYLSILSQGGKKSILRTIAFVLGLSVTFLALGFGAGILGEIFYNPMIRIVGGVFVIVMGLFQAEVFRLPILERTKLVRSQYEGDGIVGPFLLGITFSLGWTPCVGPVLASILFLSSTSADAVKSLYTMGIYMLGMATPFVIFSLASEKLITKTNGIKKYLPRIKKIGGYMIIVMGIILIMNQMNIFLY